MSTSCLETAERKSSAFLARPFAPRDAELVSSWVSTREALHLVSSDDADRLTPDILFAWTQKACAAFVVADQERSSITGFCTMSVDELPGIPPSYIELCHLIVNPRFRYFFVGPRLCQHAKHLARMLNKRYLLGRVLPSNRYALLLARRERFVELTHPKPWLLEGFRWFRFRVPPSGRSATYDQGVPSR